MPFSFFRFFSCENRVFWCIFGTILSRFNEQAARRRVPPVPPMAIGYASASRASCAKTSAQVTLSLHGREGRVEVCRWVTMQR